MRTNAALLLGYVGIFVVLFLVLHPILRLLGTSASETARIEGFAAGLGLGVILILISTQSGAFAISAGGDAEEWTSKELRKLRESGYLTVDNIEFQGFNVDHVAIGPAGAFAIETKWASARWVVIDGRIDGPLRDPIGQALDGA